MSGELRTKENIEALQHWKLMLYGISKETLKTGIIVLDSCTQLVEQSEIEHKVFMNNLGFGKEKNHLDKHFEMEKFINMIFTKNHKTEGTTLYEAPSKSPFKIDKTYGKKFNKRFR
jgi:hypothetical protein